MRNPRSQACRGTRVGRGHSRGAAVPARACRVQHEASGCSGAMPRQSSRFVLSSWPRPVARGLTRSSVRDGSVYLLAQGGLMT